LCEEAVLALAAAGFTKVDYVAVREAESLKTVSAPTERPLRVLAAAWLGGTRLIDNLPA
jgi:pantoate--beta-alanine ligase